MPTPNVGQLLAHPQVRAAIERALAAKGVRGDTIIAHLDPREAAMLRMMGGAGTVNPRTGLRQFYPGGGDPDAGGVGGSSGRGSVGGQGSGGGNTDPDRGGVGTGGGPGAGRTGRDGGYGHAGDTSGSGAGAGGGHSGDSGGVQYRDQHPQPPVYQPPPLPPPPVINNLPGAPVPLTPMMSSNATRDLAGGERFGALPSWATQPYQVGTAPSSYPTPGVDAGIGAPGYAGNPLLGQGGGGGGGSGAGGDGGAVAGPYVGSANVPPGSPQDYWAQMLASGQGSPGPGLQAFYAATGGGLGSRQPQQGQQQQPQSPQIPVSQGLLGGGAALPGQVAGLTTPAQRLARLAAMRQGTPGAQRW